MELQVTSLLYTLITKCDLDNYKKWKNYIVIRLIDHLVDKPLQTNLYSVVVSSNHT